MNWLGDLFRNVIGPDPQVTKPKLFHLWSIGIYGGQSPLDMKPRPDVPNPALRRENVTDVIALFVADPFMISRDGTWYMFFEVMNGQTGKGEIGLATSDDGLQWRYQQIVLQEPFHLSYPYVFTYDGHYYMLPETHKACQVRLYKAEPFPTTWKYCRTLLDGGRFADTSILWYENTWWLFTETATDLRFDTLRLYYSHHLFGDWTEHHGSPVIRGNPHTARPAGRLLRVKGQLYRFAQDCFPRYGMRVRTMQILELTPERYREQEISANPSLTGTGTGWNEAGMHHLDAHEVGRGNWIGCVDGWTGVPLETYMKPVRER